jgi:hypothetical protein
VKALFFSLVITGFYLGSLSQARAQRASDSMQNYPATAGSGIWNNGDNLGFGFQPWQFVSTSGNAGLFVGDSMQNGGPPDAEGFQSKGINSPNARSWGAFANSGGAADAIRPFSALAAGETFSADFDNGFIDNGGSEGVRLADSSTGFTMWQFLFTGGQNVYQVFDGRGFVDTTLPFTDDGLHIDFTLTGTTTYSATIREADGATQTLSGSLANAGNVSQFAFFDHNGGFQQVNNVYANNLAIVPEPSSTTLFLINIGAGLVLLRRTGLRFLR